MFHSYTQLSAALTAETDLDMHVVPQSQFPVSHVTAQFKYL